MSAYQTLNFKITGLAPLLMHNGQLADPLNQHSKHIAAITGKRHKTEADHLEMARREWLGCLYVSGGSPCIPGEMIEAAIVKGAMKEKRGPQAKAGILVEDNVTLEYDGPKDAKELWEDKRFQFRKVVRVGTDSLAWRGTACLGKAWRSSARFGPVWHGRRGIASAIPFRLYYINHNLTLYAR